MPGELAPTPGDARNCGSAPVRAPALQSRLPLGLDAEKTRLAPSAVQAIRVILPGLVCDVAIRCILPAGCICESSGTTAIALQDITAPTQMTKATDRPSGENSGDWC